MKIASLLIGCMLLFSSSTHANQQSNENPTVVFYVKHLDEPEIDYVELSLSLQTKDTSLTSSLKNADSDVKHIVTLAQQFCEEHAKKKGQCKDIVEAGVFQIKPRYQMIRKQPVFMGFTITHEISIAVKSVQNIGYLVDRIQANEGVTLNGFDWKASKEHKVSEEAIAEGMKEGGGLCQQLGLEMSRVISAEQVYGSEAEAAANVDEKDGEEGDEEDEDEGELSVFKFEVECAGKLKSKKE